MPYILAYKLTLEKLPQNEEFCKNSHISRPPKYHGVLFGLITRVSICNALMKLHYQSLCFGNNITGKLSMKRI